MRDAIKRAIDLYADKGVPTGDFLLAVLEHDLFDAFARADAENERDMREIIQYIYWNVPALCHGSPERVRTWIESHRPMSSVDVISPVAATTACEVQEEVATPEVSYSETMLESLMQRLRDGCAEERKKGG